MGIADKLNSHEFLYLIELDERLDNSLRIIVREAKVSEESSSMEGASGLTGRAIESTEQTYEIIFQSYIGYSVLDESYAMPNETEKFEGRVFCIYQKSMYLDYLKIASCASEEYPGVFIHYGVNCLNHLIDIASVDEPDIQLLEEGE